MDENQNIPSWIFGIIVIKINKNKKAFINMFLLFMLSNNFINRKRVEITKFKNIKIGRIINKLCILRIFKANLEKNTEKYLPFHPL